MIKWLWLHTIPFIGPITINILLDNLKEPEAIYSASYDELNRIKGINKRQIQQILQNRSLEQAKNILEECYKNEITIITKNDLRYPAKAKVGYDEPAILYCKGNFKPIIKSAAVVGPRRCTQDEKKRVVELTSSLVEQQYIIISGMAKGVDSYAHTICLKKGGYTVAVLGCGVDYCYPKEHELLMKEIIENGLLISEYPPGTKPSKYSFVRRNRIISGWSDCVYRVGERRKSGAQTTEEFAKIYGKDTIRDEIKKNV